MASKNTSESTVTFGPSEGIFGGPAASVYPLPDHGVRNLKVISQFRQAPGNTANGENTVTPLVSGLLLEGLPPDISRFVALGIINPSDGQSQWFFSNIGKKVLKLLPSLANCDSPATIVRPVSTIRIPASTQNSFPGRVCSRSASTRRMTMRKRCFSCHFSLKASTGACVSTSQVVGEGFNPVSAIALTQAPTIACSARMNSWRKFFDHSKALKSITDLAIFGRHNVMALCSAAAFGYRPDVCRDSFLPLSTGGVNA
jgi:hypothetical protein